MTPALMNTLSAYALTCFNASSPPYGCRKPYQKQGPSKFKRQARKAEKKARKKNR